MVLLYIFVVLHIITAAAWFGLGLRVAGRARQIVERGGEAAAALAEDGRSSVWQMTIFIILTLVFAICAFIAGGHFSAYGPAYHTALTLIVVLVADQLFVIRPGWTALQSAITSGEEEAAEAARKRVAIGTGVGHLLWLVLLILMFVDDFALAF